MKKTDVTQPVAMTTPFAEGVYSATSTDDFEIPAATSTTADDSCVMDDGFLPITSTALDDGGKAPERKNFNGMFYLSTDQRFFLQNGGFITYNPDVATAIGGYPQDAILGYIDNQGRYKLVKSLIDDNTNNFVADETLIDGTNWEEIAMGGSGYEVGDVVWRLTPTQDSGKHLLDGALIQGSGSYSAFVTYIAGLVTDYPDLFATEADWQAAVTTYGVCGKFVYDSVNNTVRLPKITGFIEGTTDVTALGDLVRAGLPNITGTLSSNGGGEGLSATGALKSSTNSNWAFAHTSNSQNAHLNLIFRASDSNSIYGNSSTVQPQAIKVLYYIVIATTIKTDIEGDIDEIATDLNGKADVDLTNVNNSGTSRGAGWVMPSSIYDELTFGASGATYTAPANGWFYISAYASVDFYIDFASSVGFRIVMRGDTTSNHKIRGIIPASKGDIITPVFGTGATLSSVVWHFIYAKGSESEYTS